MISIELRRIQFAGAQPQRIPVVSYFAGIGKADIKIVIYEPPAAVVIFRNVYLPAIML